MYATLFGAQSVKIESDDVEIIGATFAILVPTGASATINSEKIITTADSPCQQIESQSVLDFAMSTTATAISFPVAFSPASTRGISQPNPTTVRVTKKGYYQFYVQLATDKTSSVFFICKKDGVNMDGRKFFIFIFFFS